MPGEAHIIRGNALDLPLADNSVDLCVTSPPYWALRSYQDGGDHYQGQIGSEDTHLEFLDNLIAAMREMVRVTKPSGSIFVNLGDKYSGAQTQNFGGQSRAGESAEVWKRTDPKRTGVPNKSLMLIPERFRIRCVDELGLIARSVIVWSKPNGLPESVTDRVRRSHEDWVHFTLQPRYYSAVDEIREEHAEVSLKRAMPHRANVKAHEDRHEVNMTQACHPLGKLPGSVWTIPTEPLIVPDHLGVDHFAAFPTEWPRRIIQGWSPAGVCVECGEGRRPVTSALAVEGRAFSGKQQMDRGWGERDPRKRSLGVSAAERDRTITGYDCACPEPTAPTTPGVVLDPFGGTGTTALVAKALGRTGISVDMSADYCRLATWRTNDPAQLAKAARKPYTPSVKPIEGQSDLLDLLAEEEPA